MALYHDFYTLEFSKLDLKKKDEELFGDIEKHQKEVSLKIPSSSFNNSISDFYDLILEGNAQTQEESNLNYYFFGNLFWIGWRRKGIKIKFHYLEFYEGHWVIQRPDIKKIVQLENKINYNKLSELSSSLFADAKWKINYDKFYQNTQEWLRVYNIALSRNEDLILSLG